MIIPKGEVVVLDTNVAPKTLRINGTLRCANDRDLVMSANWIVVDGGKLECGTEAAPFTKNLTINLLGEPSEDSISAIGAKFGVGTKVLGALNGGQIDLIGKLRTNWVKLSANALAGSNKLQLTQAVDWAAGDKIVIASSVVEDQAEERTVTSVSGNTVVLDSALKYAHTGEIRDVAGVKVDMRAEVGLLTHSIKIQGDESSTTTKFGGHVMIAGLLSNARIQGVQFTRMGQFNRLGRYPMHWHHVRDASKGYFKNNSISHTIQRGLFVHATDNLLVEGNVVFDTQGHGYGLENGTEIGNTFSRNLGLRTKAAIIPKVTLENGVSADDDQASTFWFVGGNNTFTGNVAAGGDHSGFWFDFAGDAKYFSGNTAHSYASGRAPGTNEQAGITTKHSAGMSGVVRNMLLYSNAVGAWFETQKVVLADSIFAENQMATFSTLAIENSVIIGQTAQQTGANRGIVTYNTPVRAETVTFVNMQSPAFSTFLGGPEGATFKTKGLKFVNVEEKNRIFLQVGNAYAVDADGSLLGKPGVLTPEEPSMYTNECVQNLVLRGRVCPPTPYAYQTAFIGGVKNGDTLTREDGVQQKIELNVPVFNVIAGKKYTLNRDLGPNSSVWIGGAAGSVEIKFPKTNSNFYVYECFQVGNCADESRKLLPVANQTEFDQSNGKNYFYDSAKGLLSLKINLEKQLFIKQP